MTIEDEDEEDHIDNDVAKKPTSEVRRCWVGLQQFALSGILMPKWSSFSLEFTSKLQLPLLSAQNCLSLELRCRSSWLRRFCSSRHSFNG